MLGVVLCVRVTVYKKLHFLLQGKQSRHFIRGGTSWQKTEIPGSTEEDGLASCFLLFIYLFIYSFFTGVPEWNVRFFHHVWKQSETNANGNVEHPNIQRQSTTDLRDAQQEIQRQWHENSHFFPNFEIFFFFFWYQYNLRDSLSS